MLYPSELFGDCENFKRCGHQLMFAPAAGAGFVVAFAPHGVGPRREGLPMDHDRPEEFFPGSAGWTPRGAAGNGAASRRFARHRSACSQGAPRCRRNTCSGLKMGRPTGLEPATPRFTILCSNQLSYDRRKECEALNRATGCQLLLAVGKLEESPRFSLLSPAVCSNQLSSDRR